MNGHEIGYSEDSKSLARFDITTALKEGDNELTLKVYRFSTGSYLECQDFWRISGIERDVYLSSEKTPARFDFSVISTLDPTLSKGVFQLKMRSEARADVFYELLDPNGETVADAIYDFTGELTTVADTIPDVRKWSAETPELYTLLLKVNGEYTRFHVGFRRIEIATVKDGERDVKALLVNGQPVKFKGVNMHEHNPYTGHYQTRENILQDLKLMKMANINAIRTCHYPQPREFYELCDSLGFYVYDEANIESHGMGYKLDRTLGNNAAWQAKHLDRVLNMYHRTANYPCVTILSLGNEAGNGVNFYEAYRVLKALEKDGQNRPVCYERAEREWNTDMLVPQYPDAESMPTRTCRAVLSGTGWTRVSTTPTRDGPTAATTAWTHPPMRTSCATGLSIRTATRTRATMKSSMSTRTSPSPASRRRKAGTPSKTDSISRI